MTLSAEQIEAAGVVLEAVLPVRLALL